MKKYLYVASITSPQGCRTLYGCISRKKLVDYLSQPQYADYKIGEIRKSGRYYNTDGNTDIWYKA